MFFSLKEMSDFDLFAPIVILLTGFYRSSSYVPVLSLIPDMGVLLEILKFKVVTTM